jgi:hypothetical protein
MNQATLWSGQFNYACLSPLAPILPLFKGKACVCNPKTVKDELKCYFPVTYLSHLNLLSLPFTMSLYLMYRVKWLDLA